MTKKEALSVMERAGYTFTGYKDAGWGEKQYHFTHPNIHGETSYDLATLRIKARHLDTKMWYEAYRAELAFGIQEELFGKYEIYEIENPLIVA